MAWTEQCKLAFYTNVHNKVTMAVGRKRVSMARLFKELSEESGIPAKTLASWWYAIKETEKKLTETRQLATDENNKENQQPADGICIKCGKEPVFKTTRGKPLSKHSIHYGLCNSCRWNEQQYILKDVECPHCHKIFNIKKERR